MPRRTMRFDEQGHPHPIIRKGSTRRIALYGINADKPHYYLRANQAQDLLNLGKAEVINDVSIRLLRAKDPVARSSVFLKCGQGDAYEKSAIEEHPQFFQGGLDRTEHQPAKFNRFKGARVGHQ